MVRNQDLWIPIIKHGGRRKYFVALPDAPPNPIDSQKAKGVERQRKCLRGLENDEPSGKEKCLIGLENDEPAADKQEGFDAVEEPVIETLFIQEEKNCKVQI